ncbi:hypothetical protein L1987_14428 [Smallanthus sonchifolius]|uniref:Uncharacterized protein n=1 Tax=Smallanthus sonchifolius TaxID=185202 RepID=A0ACB9J3B1_9ASTR|nr:hypothetical protein L1987_14428 [Smallanthus sonchifolius]
MSFSGSVVVYVNMYAMDLLTLVSHVITTSMFVAHLYLKESHINLIHITYFQELRKDYCRMCFIGFTYHNEASFSCESCKFHLHLGCALLLPETIKHKYDKHPMTLNYSPVENYDGDYFCEVCEEKFNPNTSFYHCNACVQSRHPACASLIAPTKAYICGAFRVPDMDIKFGGIHKTEHHPHPLSFLVGTKSYGDCAMCGRTLNSHFSLKCLQYEGNVGEAESGLGDEEVKSGGDGQDGVESDGDEGGEEVEEDEGEEGVGVEGGVTVGAMYYYKCLQCGYSIHKLCEELPTTLEHASHIPHALTLFLDESEEKCHVCQSIPQYKQLRYHCSQCMFNICLDCGVNEVQYHTIYHPSHQHPLVPINRQISANCDACGREHRGAFYQCTICFRSCIHNDCVLRPKRLLIQDGTFNKFSHAHSLILTYSFPKVDQEAKDNPRCRVCDNSFSDYENLWVYKCEKCRYYTHLDCAYLRGERSKSGVRRITSEKYEYNPDLHLPHSDQTYTIVKDFVFEGTNYEMGIIHNCHEHPLFLVDTLCNDITTRNKNESLCNACLIPIKENMTFYKCTYECNFVLHEWCTRLTPELKDYKSHPQHTLLLLANVGHEFLGFVVVYVDMVAMDLLTLVSNVITTLMFVAHSYLKKSLINLIHITYFQELRID